MNRTLTTAAIAAAIAVAVTPASAQGPEATVEEQIKKMEKDRAAAVTHADVSAIAAQTADDATFINRNGQLLDKAQMVSSLKSGNTKITASEIVESKVRVYGDTAIVTGRIDLRGTMGGKDISGPVRFTRVYVKGKDGNWRSVAFQQTPVSP